MRIVIDMQGAQTESRFRGIGRYTLSFVQAVVRNRGEHEIILALSGLFPDTIEPIRAAFDGLLHQANIRVWHAPGPVREEQAGNEARREVAELIREAFLANLKPDVIHICSLFEGYVDDAVTSIGQFDKRTAVSVALYDLIPLLKPDFYLKHNPCYARYYQRKVNNLKRAQRLLAISEHTRQEGLAQLDKPEFTLVNVSTAIEPRFRPLDIDNQTAKQLREKFGLHNSNVVLHTGGADERKNLPRVIQAYAALPTGLRLHYQLVFTGKMPDGNIARFRSVAKAAGLKDDELVFTGYVSDEELVQLYNLCNLYVLPSWHEGFGLTALEAMACGAPVIGANTTSLPEVIGLDEAMFDPLDVSAITTKMQQALGDEMFRERLHTHGLQRAQLFSWDKTARRAIEAWESLPQAYVQPLPSRFSTGRKPRLAYVSPLPPERTGIADYSAELLPALADHYDIELVVAQDQHEASWGDLGTQIHDVAWLRAHAGEIDRVLYHIGNSPFHRHMPSLLEEIPGVVVLHDFFLSGLIAWMELHGGESNAWVDALYASHGYAAVRDRYHSNEDPQRTYPANWTVLQHSRGVISHSKYSLSLAQLWYPEISIENWAVIPLLRSPKHPVDKTDARKKLGINPSDYVVCSFGFLGATKLNHRLFQAWISSELAKDKHSRLFFVGEIPNDEYGTNLLKSISKSGLGKRISITGFSASETYRLYLSAADLSIQLRTHSRGETSAAVLDCMNHAIPLITNANGSMAELDQEAVWLLSDEFDNEELVEALETLWRDPARGKALAIRAQTIIHTHHAPTKCAKQYANAIEHFHQCTAFTAPALVKALAAPLTLKTDDAALMRLSETIATNLPLQRPAKRLFLDVTATCRNDLKTGIERVARAVVMAMLENPPFGYRIEPVYLTDAGGVWHHCYARSYMLGLLDCPTTTLTDEPIESQNGDFMLGLDISGEILIQAERSGLFANYRACGMSVHWVVYDLLPIRMPHVFPPGADESHAKWLQSVSNFDGAVCISKSVSDDLIAWQLDMDAMSQRWRRYKIASWYLGADFGNSAPSKGLPAHAEKTLKQLSSVPTFLMVGTIEPRKGYLQTVEAFTELWEERVDVNLVIVGKEGWVGLPDAKRRDIPQTIEKLRKHPEMNNRLFWLEGISDEYMEKIYAVSSCLIAASYGEGFGLPLVEAAKHKLPIIARDIPVFREVTGEHAFYFSATHSDQLVRALRDWLALYHLGKYPQSETMRWLTWKQSAAQLTSKLMGENDSTQQVSDRTIS